MLMRVISGYLKGQKLKGYQLTKTRPTISRIKEAIMAIINYQLKNAYVLDLFAGSGAYGIEAISNGAQQVYFVDNNKEAIITIKNNLKKLGILEKSVVLLKDYQVALSYFKQQQIKFNLIFLDPPYQSNNLITIIELMLNYNLLFPGGYFVCESKGELLNYENKQLQLIKTKKYGSKIVNIYQLK